MHKVRPAYDPGDEYRERKRKLGRCICYRCDAPAGKNTPRCYKHSWAERKRRDPVAYLFHHKRQRALDRAKTQPWGLDPRGPWSLTLPEFREYCQRTGYHERTGRTATSATLDRKDNRLGYHWDNIQEKTLAENSAKGTKTEVFTTGANGEVVVTLEDLPF
jgi:hypothetical protein